MEADVFLKIPQTESLVPGLSIEIEHFRENIGDGANAKCLRDEHLKLIVDHDGSNPFCYHDRCFWAFVIASPSVQCDIQLDQEEASNFLFHCLPYLMRIEKVLVCEQTIGTQHGIWLFTFFDARNKEPDEIFNLVEYRRG